MTRQKVLITAALPYANGAIHFGHLAGSYLPADCYARFSRLLGNDVCFICGSDEYGVAIALSAEQAGKTPQEHVDHFHTINQSLFAAVGMSFDHYSRTTWVGHTAFVEDFFKTLLRNGYIEDKESERLYCEEDGRFYADRYVIGICPKCGFSDARGDECTSCGASYEAEDLKSPRSKIGNRPLTKKRTRHWYLRLDLFKDRLLQWLEGKPWKQNVINFIKKYIEDVRPRAITRDMKWGIPVPLEEAKGKVFYVWFDAPIGYISATKEWAESIGDPDRWQSYWLDSSCRLIQFLGKDNIPFHGAVFPAMIMGQDIPYKLVDEMPANEFYTLAGRQFSKSEGWFVDLGGFLEKYSADQLRYTIASNAPETQDAEFTWKDFQNRCNADLLGKFGNFVHRTLVFAKNVCLGVAPEAKSLHEEDVKFLERCRELASQAKSSYSQFRLRKAAQTVMEVAQIGNVYFDIKKPWQKGQDQQSVNNTIYCCLECLKILSLIAAPIIPTTSAEIIHQLGLEEQFQARGWDEQMAFSLPSGHRLGMPRPLFRKIEDEEVALEEAHLQSRTCPEQPVALPEVPTISIDEFRRVKMEVVEILKAELVPNSKKLLLLQAATSLGNRQIISGIAETFRPEELIGKRVVACVNLKPSRIKGIESQGMILAVEGESGALQLLEAGAAEVGSSIS
jgi:methionyl-tRNA synthetase